MLIVLVKYYTFVVLLCVYFNKVDATPPERKSKDCLLCLVIKDGELKVCAEDADDMRYYKVL
jgi:hypothetical protein